MWCREHTMTEFPYILFNKSPEQLRQLGARGGKAYGRNQRARRALAATPPETVPPTAVPGKRWKPNICTCDSPCRWVTAWTVGGSAGSAVGTNSGCSSWSWWCGSSPSRGDPGWFRIPRSSHPPLRRFPQLAIQFFPHPHLFPPVPLLGHPAQQPLVHYRGRRGRGG